MQVFSQVLLVNNATDSLKVEHIIINTLLL